jgi:hypothetical protein
MLRSLLVRGSRRRDVKSFTQSSSLLSSYVVPPLKPSYGLWINGAEEQAAAGGMLSVSNPATSKHLCEVLKVIGLEP